MIINMHFLGIYEDAINSAIESAENLLKREEFDFTDWDIDQLNDWAVQYLAENGSFENITDSIIYAYFSSAKEYVNKKYPNAQIDFYVNCNDSHLYYDGMEV